MPDESTNSQPKLPWTDLNAIAAWEKTILTACTDRGFREFCTGSSDHAKEALSHAGNVKVPERLRILFLDHREDEDCAVVLLPPFQPDPKQPPPPVNIERLLMCCGYRPYMARIMLRQAAANAEPTAATGDQP